IIIVGSTYLMQPSDEDIKRERERISQDSLAKANGGRTVATDTLKLPAAEPEIDSAALLSGPFGAAKTGSSDPVMLENEFLKVQLSPKGGRISSVELKEYKRYNKEPFRL